jgi:UDP-N-acetyl-D-galactosamine dehydrogenase
MKTEEKVSVIGLGYVGLPVALAFARTQPDVVGFDISADRVRELSEGHDRTEEVTADALGSTTLKWTCDAGALTGTSFFVVTVPTPIDANKQPDLGPLRRASAMIGPYLSPGTIVVYESTVYPGVTEEICGPLLEKASGLKAGVDFFLGYSPERINPGDRTHTLERIVKVVAGQTDAALERIADAYGAFVQAGVYRATSIRVAEAAKVIENTQRDLNIALMNELALIFDRMGLRTHDVLQAAGTKWNFLPFTPGLVGGHCIGVDPYYLTAKAEELGYFPQVILAGRRINDGMGGYIAGRLVKLLVAADRPLRGARVAVLGLTFKENVPDLRNSRVPDILQELRDFGIEPVVVDPMASAKEAKHEYDVTLVEMSEVTDMDAIVLAVNHRQLIEHGASWLEKCLTPGGVIIDVKSVYSSADFSPSTHYWSL